MSYRLHQPSYIKEILDKFGFKFSKALGQNFLIDGNLIENIIDYSDITEDDYVIEIGPGFGTLTERLVDKCKFLYSIEIDSRLMDVLKYTVGDRDNFQIINEDVLKVDLNELNHGDKKFKVVANLPYYITTPIIEHLFNYRDVIESITVMVQKEVANRMVADVGNKDYASLSLFVKQNSDAKIILNAPKTVFMPQPKVDSAVVNMKLKKLDEDIDQELLRQ
ncbi:MAG: 16S rRNA (adenine(1518)-N(6)/adenine(1519)-N(6))-dimethyltransferase RsmA, partial [Finegoldia magna]|nr:16S rRNA (adenine(1518)-N(6)/adenine(1519)-N(6))-dimethyltransferase RsmA [Finegoldia magna]